jgi:hypothetical protein
VLNPSYATEFDYVKSVREVESISLAENLRHPTSLIELLSSHSERHQIDSVVRNRVVVDILENFVNVFLISNNKLEEDFGILRKT